MKKFVFSLTMAAAGLSAMAASLSPSVLYKTPAATNDDDESVLMVAYDNDRDETLSWALKEDKGEDVAISIFNDQFQIVKSFTLKGIRKSQEINGEQVGNSYVTGLVVRGGDYQEMLATRNVFTNDGKWCVIVRSWQDDPVTSTTDLKLEVYNEDGENLGELPLSSGDDTDALWDGEFIFSRVFDCGGGLYYYTVGAESHYTIWSFTGNSGISAPAANKVSALKAYPNPLPADSRLNIELERPADGNTFLSVIDMKGRQIMRKRLAPGTSTTTVDGGRLHGGILIYTVSYGDGEIASGKLCAE